MNKFLKIGVCLLCFLCLFNAVDAQKKRVQKKYTANPPWLKKEKRQKMQRLKK